MNLVLKALRRRIVDISNMEIATITFRLHAPWVHSLKEKRMIVKSITAKIQNKFHVSAAEIDEQDAVSGTYYRTYDREAGK